MTPKSYLGFVGMKTQEIHIIGKWINNLDRRAIFQFTNNEWKVQLENPISGFYANSLSKESLEHNIKITKGNIKHFQIILSHQEKALQIMNELEND